MVVADRAAARSSREPPNQSGSTSTEMAAALDVGMDVLVEVHDEAELDRALRLRSRLIGINNRDLRTFKTDLGTTLRMSELVEDRGVLVSESGIHTRQDVKNWPRRACARCSSARA